MLFNSYPFLFLFFPAVLALFFLAARFGDHARRLVLLAGSLFFYAWWDARFLTLLGGSVLVNYYLSGLLTAAVARGEDDRAHRFLVTGVVFNLITLGVFKYANFFVDNVSAMTGMDLHLATIILPLGISFFTFEQIGYLVDVRRGHLYRASFLNYALFVSFFPRLIAGPILRYNEVGPQFDFSSRRGQISSDIAVGLTIFLFGLFKKVVLADGIAPFATDAFTAAAGGKSLDLLAAWGGVLAYAFQLYFDFSGYSDMAIGAARCFGIKFPMNFNSPYKATSIVAFWHRWHITLSRFLRDYLYVSLGGNRKGPVRRYANLMMTMLLGGFWHGANWTFMVWGALHGFYLMVNHAWLALTKRSPLLSAFRMTNASHIMGFAVTFLAVLVAWVFFRAPDFGTAISILAGMTGAHGLTLPDGLAVMLQDYAAALASVGITFGDASVTYLFRMYMWVGALFIIAVFAPNTQQILAVFDPVLEPVDAGVRWPRLQWSFAPRYAVAAGIAGFLAVISITRVSEFLYWQF